jgi:hypothetical protein
LLLTQKVHLKKDYDKLQELKIEVMPRKSTQLNERRMNADTFEH